MQSSQEMIKGHRLWFLRFINISNQYFSCQELADASNLLNSLIEDLEKLNLDIPGWIVLFTNKALSNLRRGCH